MEDSPAVSDAQPAPTSRAQRLAIVFGVVAVAMLFLRQVVYQNTFDLDLFHQMALVRAAMQVGHFPTEDVFAFTPTVRPSVHYEWGNGAIALVMLSSFGDAGLLILKYALTVAVAGLTVRTARLRGAGWPAITLLAPLAILMSAQGFTTIRAGLFTLAFLALLLRMLEADRSGRRAWVLLWLPALVLWLNIHPGFVVGLAIVGAYWIEQLIRDRKPRWHLLGAGAAVLVLIFVNPYGRLYPPAVWHAVTSMRLPPIPEWLPMWKYPEPRVRMAYAMSLLLAVYCFARVGWRHANGSIALLVCAIAALQRGRHADLYAVVWLAYVPAWFQATPQGELLDRIWKARPRLIAIASIAVSVACVPFILRADPLHVKVPTSLQGADQMGVQLVYPVGAADFLSRTNFRGNLMTHYNDGSYVMWRLWPAGVKIGMDSRNDVGYRYELIDEIQAMYSARPGWRETLGRYGADAILINRAMPLARHMPETDWQRVYTDQAFEIWNRPSERKSIGNVDRPATTRSAIASPMTLANLKP